MIHVDPIHRQRPDFPVDKPQQGEALANQLYSPLRLEGERAKGLLRA